MRRSKLDENTHWYNAPSSFPQNFKEIGQERSQAQASTGYYFVDSEDNAPYFWRPIPVIVDTATQHETWYRILPGARIQDQQHWIDNPDEGFRFFRNPAKPDGSGLINYFEEPCDTTDNAFAGPIPIGFEFYFNGLRYDSFYITTNGLIALTNRRYFYDEHGDRTIPQGEESCYDPHSADWFVRSRSGDGLNDPTPDDFGYLYSVLGKKPEKYDGGIRKLSGALNTFDPRNRAALIAPFFGDNQLSQFHKAEEKVDDWGKCYYKRNEDIEKLIIYFVNMAPVGEKNTPSGDYYAEPDLRWGEESYVAASAQVQLNAVDSSIKITYERFEGVAIVNKRAVPSSVVFRYNTTVGVRGFARHVGYETDNPQSPWAEEYEQYTHYFSHFESTNVNYPYNYLAIKFKQWQNTLRITDIQYRMRPYQNSEEYESTDDSPEFTDDLSDIDTYEANSFGMFSWVYDLFKGIQNNSPSKYVAPEEASAYSRVIPSSQTNNFEFFANSEFTNGHFQPVVLVQNLTNNIQGPDGVNFFEQEANFKVRMTITNKAKDRIVYNRVIPVDSTCLAINEDNFEDCTGDPNARVCYVDVAKEGEDYTATEKEFPGEHNLNGIPPYEYVQIFFPPFQPSEYTDNHIGLLEITAYIDPTDPNKGTPLGDQWPFDDTTRKNVFMMKRLESNFSDNCNDYVIINRVALPSDKKWVNIDAEVVPGEDVSLHPIPPRGDYEASNKEGAFMSSPVLKLSRTTLRGAEPPNSPGGDELRSFPIDMRNKYNSVISLSVQRTARNDDWERGWSDQTLIGAEPRTIVNGDVFHVWKENSDAASFQPDELLVELAQPSPDGERFITNIPENRWSVHPRRDGAPKETEVPALTIYGGGGYMVGFLETDKDSALAPPEPGVLNGLRPNVYDDGIDYEYKRYFVPIPDAFINAENEGAKNFRFRLKVNATNDKKCVTCIPDDDDLFFVDNVKLIDFSNEGLDLAIDAIHVDWPYTQVPASQATDIPFYVKITNLVSWAAPTFVVKLWIYRKDNLEKEIYCHNRIISSLPGRAQSIIQMPNWNAREWGPGEYRAIGIVTVPGGDMVEENDTTYFDFEIKFGDSFAYDPVDGDPVNNVPEKAFTGINGRGLNMFAYSYGGEGNIYGPTSGYPEEQAGAGDRGGAGSGQIAVKFELQQTDTIKGLKVYYSAFYHPDPVRITIYKGSTPDSLIEKSILYTERAVDDLRKDIYINQYVTQLYDEPVIVPKGTYWIVLAQLGETGIEIGASKSRAGMRTMNISIPEPLKVSGEVGDEGNSLFIEKTFRELIGFDPFNQPVIVNRNFFAYENGIGSGNWKEFAPEEGNPGYAHLHHFGTSPADGRTATLSRGTWIPMIRPYLGEKSYSTDTEYPDCDRHLPVELYYFTCDVFKGGILVEWGTASEYDNKGFHIERRLHDDEYEWEVIAFVEGVGNSATDKQYSYVDESVELDNTYQYRLKQEDHDATCSYTDVVTVRYDHSTDLKPDPRTIGNIEYLENMPNPFTDYTVIKYSTAKRSDVSIEIIDLMGNIIKRYSKESQIGPHQVIWDGTDHSGNLVSTGTYIYRMTSGDEVATGKMTLVR